MSTAQDSPLSERHLALFGAIIQCFANYEALINELMAQLGGGSATSVKLLTADLGFAEKRNALLNLMRHRNVSAERFDQIMRFLAVPQTHAALRGDIAHSVWMKSQSDNSIHPKWLSHGQVEAVRPVHDIDRSSQIFQERPEGQASYTLDELEGIRTILTSGCERFRQYLEDHNVIESR